VLTDRMTIPGKVPLREKICYGMGDLAGNLYWNTFGTYLLFFYTDVFGISAAAAGTLCLVAWLLDGAMNPIMGLIADRTETRYGKFRPYLLWISIPLTVTGVLTFTTPHFAPAGMLIWAYATFVPVMILYAAYSVPYSAMLGVISSDQSERTSFVSIKFIFSYAGSMIIGGSLLPMARELGDGNATRGWQLSFITYGVAFIVLIGFAFFGTRERLRPLQRTKGSVIDDLRDLSSNRPWFILALLIIAYIFGFGIRGTITAHYFKYFVGSQIISIPFGGPRVVSFVALVSAFNTIGTFASILGVVFLTPVVRFAGKKRAVVILATAFLVSNAVFFFLKPNQVGAMFAWNFVGGLSSAPLFALLWSMIADVADYSEWKTGRRATGLVFSASLMCTKIGGALRSAAAGWLLGCVGFQPNVIETPEVLHGLVLLMSLIPAAIGAVFLTLAYFYPLNETKLAQIEHDLRNRRDVTTSGAA
jgi:glycoside/pentoside/hexuronide:cation symporter, GPH family